MALAHKFVDMLRDLIAMLKSICLFMLAVVFYLFNVLLTIGFIAFSMFVVGLAVAAVAAVGIWGELHRLAKRVTVLVMAVLRRK